MCTHPAAQGGLTEYLEGFYLPPHLSLSGLSNAGRVPATILKQSFQFIILKQEYCCRGITCLGLM